MITAFNDRVVSGRLWSLGQRPSDRVGLKFRPGSTHESYRQKVRLNNARLYTYLRRSYNTPTCAFLHARSSFHSIGLHASCTLFVLQLPSCRQHPSSDDCPEDKREDHQNCSVLCCVLQCAQWHANTYEEFLKLTVGLGLLLCVFAIFLAVCFYCVRFSFFSSARDRLTQSNIVRVASFVILNLPVGKHTPT